MICDAAMPAAVGSGQWAVLLCDGLVMVLVC